MGCLAVLSCGGSLMAEGTGTASGTQSTDTVIADTALVPGGLGVIGLADDSKTKAPATFAVFARVADKTKIFDPNYSPVKGNGLVLAEKKEVVTVIYFWAGRNEESLKALHFVIEAAKEYPSVEFSGINLDPSNVSVLPGSVTEKLPGRQTWEPQGMNGEVPRHMLLTEIPRVYVFNRQGVLSGAGRLCDLNVFIKSAINR